MLPIYNEFLESIEQKELDSLIKDQKIKIVPLAFMRGHSFKNAIVIADEMQGAGFTQIKNLLTRVAEGGKVIINGDLTQSDLPISLQGGLELVINKLCDGDIDEIGLVVFDRSDIVRHPLIGKILDKLEAKPIQSNITPSPKDYWSTQDEDDDSDWDYEEDDEDID